MKIYTVTDPEFIPYGRVIPDIQVKPLITTLEQVPLPDGVDYVASVQNLESAVCCNDFKEKVFGNMDIQVGYCIGYNKQLNGLEYHKSSEVNVAVTGMILMLGKQQDITKEGTYDTGKVQAFYVSPETSVELYATTLHYAPCETEETGFRCVVILPKGTNAPWKDARKADPMLFAQNKWLIAHKDAKIPEAFEGLVGENLKID